MAVHNREGGLTAEEKRIVKALLGNTWRNQDIQALLNSGGRKATVNSARITSVKKDVSIAAATDDEVEAFRRRKLAFNPATGLNQYDDERLVRAREAMMLAVQVFNSPSYLFKTELFAVLANIAWTYLLHEFFSRKNVPIIDADGRSFLLSYMIERPDCPLSDGAKRNLRSIKVIRDEVEHLLLRRSDRKWAPLFQACCLNFDKALRTHFGEAASLQQDLSFALQFARLSIDQVSSIQGYDIPPEIDALDARLKAGATDEQLADLEFQFRVIYTLDNATKSTAHFHFLQPESEQAGEVRNILQKYRIADDAYPFKPARVVLWFRRAPERSSPQIITCKLGNCTALDRRPVPGNLRIRRRSTASITQRIGTTPILTNGLNI